MNAWIMFVSIQTKKAIFCMMVMCLFVPLTFCHADEAEDHVKDQVIVKFEPGTPQSDIDALIDAYNMSLHEKIPKIGYYVLNISLHYTLEEVLTSWCRLPCVRTCEPNSLATLQSLPNDYYFFEQWSLCNTNVLGSTDNAHLHMKEAWEVESGDPNMIIAVIDMGFDVGHEDLQRNIWRNPGEIPENGIDDDDNGYVDDIIGWDFVNQTEGMAGSGYDWQHEDNDPTTTKVAHGNSVLGIIGATTDNTIGIAGIIRNCKLMLLRAGYFKPNGMQALSIANIAKSLIYAADNGARVINISSVGKTFSQSYEDALAYAIDQGALVTCSAGNEGSDTPVYPAAYDLPGIISVGATTRMDRITAFSNYGNWVDVSAPGESIMTTILDNGYGKVIGTSFSSPMVAAIAGLIFSRYPDLTPADVQDTIMNNVDILDGLSNANITSGRVNAYKALQNPVSEDPLELNMNDAAAKKSPSHSDNGLLNGCFISTTEVSGLNRQRTRIF